MPWFELTGDERITQRCATDDCGGQPTHRLEAGGVGSNYCSGCKSIIERGQRYFGDDKVIVSSPPDDSYIKRLFVGDGR